MILKLFRVDHPRTTVSAALFEGKWLWSLAPGGGEKLQGHTFSK